MAAADPGAERASLERTLELLAPHGRLDWSPHHPTVRQLAALRVADETREVFFGGAAGGGKSDWLLMAALAYAHVPGYAALIVRRTFAQLSKADSLIPRSHEWLTGRGPHWNGDTRTWTFPSGATMEFGHLEHSTSRYNYQGPAYQFVGFDELTQFPEADYTYVGMARVRRLEGLPVPLRTCSTSNPGGLGHDWVDERFRCNRQRWKSPPPEGRAYMPSRLADNPHLDQESYVAGLNELDPVTRARLLRGDWSVRDAGGFLKSEWFEVVDRAPAGGREVRAWDLASTLPHPGNRDPDWTEGCRAKLMPDGTLYLMDYRSLRAEPGAVLAAVLQTAKLDGRGVWVRWEEEGGSSGKIASAQLRRLLAGFTSKAVRATGSKTSRAVGWANLAEAGGVKLVAGPWVRDFLDQVDVFGSGSGHDDKVDAASLCYAELTGAWGWSDLYPAQATEEAHP